MQQFLVSSQASSNCVAAPLPDLLLIVFICWQDFGEHGREFISSEVGLRFLQVMADPALLQQYVGSSNSRRLARIQAILKHTVFKVCG